MILQPELLDNFEGDHLEFKSGKSLARASTGTKSKGKICKCIHFDMLLGLSNPSFWKELLRIIEV